MKKVIAICLGALLVMALAACGANKEDMRPATEFPAEPLVYRADLTHDGTDETIAVDLSRLETQGAQNAKVSVFGGGEKLLWSGDASIIHAGNNGIYLYRENEYAYLLTWHPYAGQGAAYLRYEIFSLDENGEALIYRKGEGNYRLDAEMSAGFNGRLAEANLFIRDVNRYLERSVLLVATTTEGAYFGTPEQPVVRLADEFPWDY